MKNIWPHKGSDLQAVCRYINTFGIRLSICIAAATSSGCALHASLVGAEATEGVDTYNHPMTEYVPDTGWYDPNLEPRLEHRTIINAPSHRTARPRPPEHDLSTKPLAWGVLMSEYGFRVNPTGNHEPRKHNGIDYAAPVGTDVYAAGDGVVVYRYLSKSYGNYLRIKHANGFSSVYAHLHAYAAGMKDGAIVKRGQVIGKVGNTGRSTGPHLHFEIIHRGKSIDPLYAERKSRPNFAERKNRPNFQASNINDPDAG